jgi:hypothetical protein
MSYRAVVRHVRYWRGAIHKWSTVYQFVGTPSSGLTSTDAEAMRAADAKMCFGAVGTGGAYECALYNQASGGVPIAISTAFDWTAPGSWPGYPTTVWTTASGNPAEPAETALSVTWAAGVSSSGKPVNLRKWYHSVPMVGEASGGAADVPTAQNTLLRAQAQTIVGTLASKGLTLGSAAGRFAGVATVDPYYGNHQMPRGRRRGTTAAVKKQSSDFQQVLQLLENQGYSQANS